MSVTGGGVAIAYTEEHFYVEDAGIETPEVIEAAWVRLTPKKSVKKILVGEVYISPQSQFKQASIKPIIQSIFVVQSRYDSQVIYLIGLDFNKVYIGYKKITSRRSV